jgi:hypothetical protein
MNSSTVTQASPGLLPNPTHNRKPKKPLAFAQCSCYVPIESNRTVKFSNALCARMLKMAKMARSPLPLAPAIAIGSRDSLTPAQGAAR